LLYYDFQPLLFFWVISDIFNNQVLWTNYSYWIESGQPNTYWLYMAFLIGSLSILINLNNLEWLINAVGFYLVLYLFSTIRYCVNIYSENNGFLLEDFRALFITAWYFFIWVWILFKLKREKLYKSL
jgi:hypothetical protein|tara:strand:+ start:322 stop:702 length:381 start_codon:yes stop_codon:yes gene_type:complete